MYQIVETETDFIVYENGKEMFKESKTCNTLEKVVEFINVLGGQVNEIKRICE